MSATLLRFRRSGTTAYERDYLAGDPSYVDFLLGSRPPRSKPYLIASRSDDEPSEDVEDE